MSKSDKLGNDRVKCVEKDAFVMPAIPEELAIDPLLLSLLHLTAFLDLSGESTVELDWSVEAMEYVTHYLQRLNPRAIEMMEQDLSRLISYSVAQGYPDRFIKFLNEFLPSFGLRKE